MELGSNEHIALTAPETGKGAGENWFGNVEGMARAMSAVLGSPVGSRRPRKGPIRLQRLWAQFRHRLSIAVGLEACERR